MQLLLTIFMLVVLFGSLIFVHELGHFIAALKTGVVVEEFAFGFGPKLFSRRHKDILYRVNLLFFLGGYVKMLGDMDGSSFNRITEQQYPKAHRDYAKKMFKEANIDPEKASFYQVKQFIAQKETELPENDIEKLHNFFNYDYIPNHPGNFDNKSFGVRALIITAGVIMNFFFGAFLFYILFLFSSFTVDLARVGEPTFLLADTSAPPVLYQGYTEETKDLEGSIIVEMDGEVIISEEQLNEKISSNYNKEIETLFFNQEGNVEASIIFDGDELHTNFNNQVRDKVVLYSILEEGAANDAGLKSGDVLLTFNDAEVTSPDHLRELLDENQGHTIDLEYINTDGEDEFTLVELPVVGENEPILGAVPIPNSGLFYPAIRVSYLNSKPLSGFAHSVNIVGYNVTAMAELVKQASDDKSVAPIVDNVNSVVAIADVTYQLVGTSNFLSILNLAALISIVLAIVNILPIPLLDGGQLLFLIIEKIRGKKLDPRVQMKVGQVAFMILILFTIFIIVKDIIQLDYFNRLRELLGVGAN